MYKRKNEGEKDEQQTMKKYEDQRQR